MITALILALWLGLPIAGILAAMLVSGWPGWSVTRWWSVAYAGLVTTLSAWVSVYRWFPSPEDALPNGIHLAATALAAGALVTTILSWRRPLPAHGPDLVRTLASITCGLSAVAWVFVILIGSPEG